MRYAKRRIRRHHRTFKKKIYSELELKFPEFFNSTEKIDIENNITEYYLKICSYVQEPTEENEKKFKVKKSYVDEILKSPNFDSSRLDSVEHEIEDNFMESKIRLESYWNKDFDNTPAYDYFFNMRIAIKDQKKK